MQIKIPKLKSAYIPVISASHFSLCSPWREQSTFYYPYVLANLIHTKKENVEEYNLNDPNLFLLTDSGGFQVIRGEVDLDWKSSLQKQIELGATKIFSFDIPPVKRQNEFINNFISMEEYEVREIINKNLDTALKQSKYLEEKYPEEFKKFCYVLQTTSLDSLNYNMEIIEKKIGIENYINYFPGGIVYSSKSQDYIFYAMAAKHARINFIDKGIYVHFLGVGSFYRILLMVRNKITTFDSSNALQGVITWSAINPINTRDNINLSKDSFPFVRNFCTCPECITVDYNDLLKKKEYTNIGRHLVNHNLWHILKTVVFLNAVNEHEYTKIVLDTFKLPEHVKTALDFIDKADKDGFNVACDKYKHFITKDKSKQKRLF